MKFVQALKWFGISIIVIAVIILRFYGLGQVPQGLNIDEASYGYDAYSILKTGRDQWGHHLPLSLKSFGDYKPAGLAYTLIPFIKIWGLNTFTTRIPSAVAGLILVYLMFIILQKISPSKTTNLILAVIFSFSPWAYGLSRLFYEPNIALVFFLLGWLFTYLSFKSAKKSLVIFSGICFALAGYWYTAFRVISVVIILFAGIILYFQNRRYAVRYLLTVFSVFIFVSLPLIPEMIKGKASTRLKQEKEKLYTDYQMSIDDKRAMCYLASNKNLIASKLCYILWNKPVVAVERTFSTLVNNISSDYLFQNSYQADIVPKGYGAYLNSLSVLYLLGLLYLINNLFKRKQNIQLDIYILGSFVITQLPVLIIQAPLVHRNIASLFFAFVIIGYGWKYFHETILTKLNSITKYILLSFAVFIITFQIFDYLAIYYFSFTKTQPDVWRYDQELVMNYVQSHIQEYDQVIFSDFEDAPLYYAFYSKADPQEFQANAVMGEPNFAGWMHYSSFGKILVKNGDLAKYLCDNEYSGKVLYVTTPQSKFSKAAIYHTRDFTDVHTLHEIYDLSSLEKQLSALNFNRQRDCPKSK